MYYPGDSVSVQVPNIQYGRDLEIAYDSVQNQYYISRLGKPFKLLNIAIQEADWIKQLNGIPMKQFDDLDEIKDCVNKGGLIQAVRRNKNRRHSRRPSTQLIIERANSDDKRRLSLKASSLHSSSLHSSSLHSSSSSSLSSLSSSTHSRMSICPGTFMRLYNLKAQKDKNGLIVEIIEKDKNSNRRWMVQLANDRTSNNNYISINEANLQPINQSLPRQRPTSQRKRNSSQSNSKRRLQQIAKPDHLRGKSDGSNGSIRGKRMTIQGFNPKYDGKQVRVLQPKTRNGLWEVKIQNTEQRIDIPRNCLIYNPTRRQ